MLQTLMVYKELDKMCWDIKSSLLVFHYPVAVTYLKECDRCITSYIKNTEAHSAATLFTLFSTFSIRWRCLLNPMNQNHPDINRKLPVAYPSLRALTTARPRLQTALTKKWKCGMPTLPSALPIDPLPHRTWQRKHPLSGWT